MKFTAWIRQCLRSLALLGAGLLPLAVAAQSMQPLDDAALADVAGQGLLVLTNSSYDGLDFMRVGVNADIQLNANFSNIRLGEYTYSARNGTGADIDIPLVRFGRSDLTDAQRLVQLTDPYLEFVFRGTGTTRELIGARFGFNGISGDIGLQIAALSGSLLINGGALGNVDSSTDPLGGKRWDGSCSSASCLTLASLGGVTAGDASGASRDFWVAMLKSPVQFAPVAGMSVPAVAQPGVWLNWTDRLQAIQVNAGVAPNLPKLGP
jgi:hypothetical protein